MQPKRREEGLSLRQFDDELLIFDETTYKAHSLNRAAAIVFRLCDGTRSVAEIEAAVAAETHVSAAEAALAVELALERLSGRGLLVESVPPASRERRITRRKTLQMIGVAVALVPLIVSLRAPAAAAVLSAIPLGGACKPGADDGQPGCMGGLICIWNQQKQGYFCSL